MSNWQTRRLDEYIDNGAITLGRGNIISKDDINLYPGPYPIYSSSAHNNGKFGEYAEFMFNEELVTWSVDGGGSLFYRPKHKFSVTNVCGFMRVKDPYLDAKFIYYCLSNQHKYIAFDYTSKAHPSVIKKLYSLPDIDLKIQRKIAHILSVIDETIKKTEELIEKYQQMKIGLMQDLFTRGIGVDGKIRPYREQATELYHETKIGWIPRGWNIYKVRDLALPFKGSTVIGPFGSDLVVSDYRSEGTPIIFVRDVKEDCFKWVSNTFISNEKTQKLFAHRVKAGDILATKMGLPPCVSCLYPEGASLAIITADMIRLTPDLTKVNAKWLSAAINEERTKNQVAAITAGVTRPKVTLADFRNLKIAAPDITEQQRIIAILNKKWELIRIEEQKLEKLNKQKTGLMKDLLTGKKIISLSTSETDCV